MGKHASGIRWHLSCRTDNCPWSNHVTVPRDADPDTELLVVLRAHADGAKHGRHIEGVAVGANPDVDIIILKHP